MIASRKAAIFVACLVILAGFAEVRGEWLAVGNITGVLIAKSGRVELETSSHAKVSIELTGDYVVRVRIAPSGRFERDVSYAIDYSVDRQTPVVKVTQTAGQITLTNFDGAKVIIKKAPFSIVIFDESGAVVLRDDTKHPTVFDKTSGEIRTTKLRRSEVETYYGFGEKAFSEMSRNDKYIVNWNTDTFSYPIGTDPIYQSIPFFFGLYDGKAYGLFFNNTFRTYF